MIYEFRTYNLVPGSLPEFLKRFGEAYEHRKAYSEMSAFWYTDIGPLNQVIHVWPYKDLNERARIRGEALKGGKWPPKVQEFCVDQMAEIYVPTSFSPELAPGKHGPIYEMRTYTLKPGTLPEVVKRWEKVIDKRTALSPLAGAFGSDLGPVNRFVHIWPYGSLAQRQEVRAKALASDHWPPPGGSDFAVRQETKILLPAPFSPMQ
jgi:hypothetical protein